MKYYIFLLFLSVVFQSRAQTEEELITITVNDFLEGGTNGEVERFKNSFMKDAVQKATGNKGVTTMTAEGLASKITPGQVLDRTTKILSVSYAGTAATAITETEYAGSKIIDMLNLLKVGADWKIVSRVYSRIGKDEDLQASGGLATKKGATTKAAPAAKPAPKPKKVVDPDGW